MRLGRLGVLVVLVVIIITIVDLGGFGRGRDSSIRFLSDPRSLIVSNGLSGSRFAGFSGFVDSGGFTGRSGLGRLRNRAIGISRTRTRTRISKCRNLGTREGILEFTVIERGGVDSLIFGRVRAGKVSNIRRGGLGVARTALDLDLSAIYVKFGTIHFVCQVEGNNLMTDDIIAIFKSLRDRELVRFIRHYRQYQYISPSHKLLTERSLDPGISSLTSLGNLEKVGFGGIKLVCRLAIWDLHKVQQ